MTKGRLYTGFVVDGDICDMIKRNASDVGYIDFEILAKTVQILFVLYCFSIAKFSVTL